MAAHEKVGNVVPKGATVSHFVAACLHRPSLSVYESQPFDDVLLEVSVFQ